MSTRKRKMTVRVELRTNRFRNTRGIPPISQKACSLDPRSAALVFSPNPRPGLCMSVDSRSPRASAQTTSYFGTKGPWERWVFTRRCECER
jgi:hypothetical protein